MASFVWLDGLLGKRIYDNARIVQIESLKRSRMNEIKYEPITCVYWNRMANCELNFLHEGSKVCIKGRIEHDENIGVYVLVETLEYLMPPQHNDSNNDNNP